jgi:hypothetical protein
MKSGIERLIAATTIVATLAGCSNPFLAEPNEVRYSARKNGMDITYFANQGQMSEGEEYLLLPNSTLANKVRYELCRRSSGRATFDKYEDFRAIFAIGLFPPFLPLLILGGLIGGFGGGERVITDVEALPRGGLRVSATKILPKGTAIIDENGYGNWSSDYEFSHTVIYDRESNDIPDEDSFTSDSGRTGEKPTKEEYKKTLGEVLEQMREEP